MGARANYAIRQNGQIELFYSHWGANTIAEDVFWGPARTESFIRKNERTVEWLDNVFAEGGIALDHDNRHMVYYYLQWPEEDDIRRVYESLLEETWSSAGWTVQRAEEWFDLTSAVGIPRELVTSEPTGPLVIAFDKLGENLAKPFCCGLLSVRTGAGWGDRAIDFTLAGTLMNGPALFDQLPSVADIEELRAAFARRKENDSAKTLGDWIDEFCAIDPVARTIRVSFPDYETDSVPFVQEAWPGWSVLHEDGGAAAHFAHMGRDLPPDLVPSPKPPPPDPPNRPHEECIRLIREHLAWNERRKSDDVAGHLRFIQRMNEMDGPVTPAPGFLRRVPSSRPGMLERVRFAIQLALRRLRR